MNSDSQIVEEADEPAYSEEEITAARRALAERCAAAGMKLETVETALSGTGHRVAFKAGRDTRLMYYWDDDALIDVLSIPFERYRFLSGYEAIVSYEDRMIEAAVRLASNVPARNLAHRRLFPQAYGSGSEDPEAASIALPADHPNRPEIELGMASETFAKLNGGRRARQLTLKLSGCNVSTHDESVALLKKLAGAVFFQIDLLTGYALTLDRERQRPLAGSGERRRVDLAQLLQYPKTEFDEAPMSLYWYAKSAEGMPLLQFLAFYQAIEFYFPTYSKAEAQRKLKTILKDPLFRGDRDADIGKLLSAVSVTRGGGFGDERSQLRSTILECVDPDRLREFFEAVPARREFYASKESKTYHRIPLTTPNADLRNDVADRIYDIRCKIVHTKSDPRDNEFELLLPFTHEAEELTRDIDLVQYVAQQVLIAGSAPLELP